MASDPMSTSRRRHIPGTRVFNWQSPETQGTKPLVRRPMTACEACRIAKVKCNGKRQCERCRSRRLRCTYVTTSKDVASVETEQGLVTPSTTKSQTPSHLYTNSPSASESLHMGSSEGIGLPEGAFNNTLEQFDWFFEDGMNLDNPNQPLMAYGPSVDDMNFFQSPVETLSSNEDRSQRPATLSEPLEVLSLDRPLARTGCQCRATLMLQIPSLECVMLETPKPRLDKMFNVIGEVISSCHSVIDCANCRIGPVDLVCILTVFQKTATCFNHIVKSGLEGNVKVSMGDYEVQLNDDPAFKGILVLNLVKQANSMLDALSTRGHDIFLSQNPTKRKVMNLSPACLNQLNLGYVQEVITKFRKLFRLMAATFGERESDTE